MNKEKQMPTTQSKLRRVAKMFDEVSFRVYDDALEVHVGISRPSNAPRHRRTEADRTREKLYNSENVNLAYKARDLLEIDDVFDYLIEKYNL